MECILRCLQEPLCRSIDMYPSAQACYLNSHDCTSAPAACKAAPDSDLYEFDCPNAGKMNKHPIQYLSVH